MRSKTVQVGVHSEPQQWAEKQFAGAKLTDVRRVARVKKIAETMAGHPGRRIPKLCGSPYAVKATYHLCQHDEATPDNMHITTGHKVGQNHRWKNRPGCHVGARVPCCRLSNDKKRALGARGASWHAPFTG